MLECVLVILVYLRVFQNFRDFMSIFVIYIRWLLGNSVGLGWVGLAMPICNAGKTKLDDGTVKG